eukprot:gene135-biopygen273
MATATLWHRLQFGIKAALECANLLYITTKQNNVDAKIVSQCQFSNVLDPMQCASIPSLRAAKGYRPGRSPHQTDPTYLAKRSIFGAGARYTLDANPELKTANHFGLGAFYEDEEYASDITLDNEQNVRLNIYWAYRNRLAQNMTYTSTLYFQPDIRDVSDNKGIWQNAVTISVTSTISLSVTWDALYDTQAPDGSDDSELEYKSIIIYNF